MRSICHLSYVFSTQVKSTCRRRIRFPDFSWGSRKSNSNLLLEARTINPRFAPYLWNCPYTAHVVLFIICSCRCVVSIPSFFTPQNAGWPQSERKVWVPMGRHWSFDQWIVFLSWVCWAFNQVILPVHAVLIAPFSTHSRQFVDKQHIRWENIRFELHTKWHA